MSLCPEHEQREAMSDEDFWAHVWAHVFQTVVSENEDFEVNDEESTDVKPCPVCRSVGPCSYDSESQPMIHVIEEKDE